MVEEEYTEQSKMNDFIEDFISLIDQYGYSLEQSKQIVTDIIEL